MARTDFGAILSTKIADTSQAIRDVENTVGLIAPADWGSRIRAMHSSSDYSNVMAQLVEETTTPASIASFTDGANNLPIKELICTINPTETGTGAKSPSNPYVIGGHTELNLWLYAQNILNPNSPVYGNYTINPDGTHNEATDRLATGFIPCKANTLYTAITDRKTTENYYSFIDVAYYDENKSFISRNIGTSLAVPTFTFTTPATAKYLVYSEQFTYTVNVNPTAYETYHRCLVEGSASEYIPYTGNTYNIPFGQTVYGGELNVTTGVLTVDWYKRRITGSDTINLTSVYIKSDACDGYYKDTLMDVPTMITDYSKVTSNYLPRVARGTPIWSNVGYPNTFTINSNQIHFNIANDLLGITDYTQETVESASDKLKAYLTSHPFDVYLPTEPFDIQLDPIEVRTLLGANNIYHDCNGNTEVTYRANGALYVAQH